MNSYRQGLAGIEQRARKYVETTEDRLDWYLTAILALSFAAFGLVGLGWAALVQPARRWGGQLNGARKLAEEAARQLQDQQAEMTILNHKLFEHARMDHLTKLHTRLKFNEYLEQLWPRVQRYGESYCAIMCDVDQFKQYNDTYGHLAGDRVLREVADALSSACRGGDQIYRYGGEEFLLVLPNCGVEGALASAERYRAAVEALRIPHAASDAGIVTISMGIGILASFPGATVETWLKQADSALYEAKRMGRNRVVAGQPQLGDAP